MGLQESKPLERRPSKTKSNLGQKPILPDDFKDFVTQLSTLACITSTSQSSFDYLLQRLPFTGHYAALPLCANISNNYSSIFVCYDCSTDDRAFLCEACFQKGNHDSHRFRVFPNNNSWTLTFCRCGDQSFMKKKTICQTHNQAPKISAQAIDKKDLAKFTVYFNEIFKILFGLMEKGRANIFQNSVFRWLQKLTTGNLYYSKILCQYVLQKNATDNECSNLRKFIKMGGMSSFPWKSVFRNMNFATQYRNQILKQLIQGLNQIKTNISNDFYELIINFAGKIENFNTLAKDQNLIVGLSKQKQNYANVKHDKFYQLLIQTQTDISQVWKSIVKNNLTKQYVNNNSIMLAIMKNLMKQQQYVGLLLQQLLQLKQQKQQNYILGCLMIQSPQFFIPSSKKPTKTPSKISAERLQKQLVQFYSDTFFDLNTHSTSEQVPSSLLLILPYFSFGQSMINKFWQQVQKRVDVISKYKEKKVIKEASMNLFQLITHLLQDFMTWDHKVLRDASDHNLLSFTKDTKLVEKVLIQFFDKRTKIPRQQMLNNVDIYTQKQRNLAKDVIKKNLRYNAKKGKYYNISKKMSNNSYNFQQLNIGAPLKFTQWQEFVGKRFFNDAFFRLVPNLIKTAQKALMQDIQMVKTVSNISVCLCLLNPSQRKNTKQVTRNFIKQIPDVSEHIYYILAKIRDRMQLDIDDAEQAGEKGTKRVKLDVITEIRDKKFRQIKERQEKMRLKWLKQAQKIDSDDELQTDDKICNICKQKQSQKRRFVYPCNFTRNNIVSSMLKSQVTDLDINICLHKVHQDCFQKSRRKGQCPICKFQINCYVPQKPLADESYTKNWLRSFQNIVTSINLQSGKSFNSDWATIFLTYLVFSKSFKLLLKNTQIQQKQRLKVDQLILLHYKSQLQKWPQLTKQAISRAQKTVKGQVRRQSNVKKVVKSLVFDMVLQQITGQPFKNAKRVQKKFRQLINTVGTQNSQKIKQCFPWSRTNAAVTQVFSSNVSDQVGQLFKIRQLSQKASQYLSKTSIKCPMCNKYQPTTWQCLFCQKISCQSCMNPRNHCQTDHKGSGIILHLSDAKYQLYHQSRQVQMDSLYRNQYEQGWTRNQDPDGWVAHTDQIYKFFDTILHSLSPFKRVDPNEDNSDNDGQNPTRGFGFGNNNSWGSNNPGFGGFGNNTGGFANNNPWGTQNNNEQNQQEQKQQQEQQQMHQQQPQNQDQGQQKQEQEQQQDDDDDDDDDDVEEIPRYRVKKGSAKRAPRPARPARPSKPAKRR